MLFMLTDSLNIKSKFALEDIPETLSPLQTRYSRCFVFWRMHNILNNENSLEVGKRNMHHIDHISSNSNGSR